MKLWQKIFLWTLFTVMFAISIIGTLILKNTFNNSIKKETENLVNEHSYMISSINNKIVTKRIQTNSILLTESDIINEMWDIFSANTNNDSSAENPKRIICLFDKKHNLIYSNSDINIDYSILDSVKSKELNVCHTQIISKNGIYRLIVASAINLEKNNYILVTTTDISDVYKSYNELLEFLKLLSIILSLICSIVLLLLAKILLKPLSTLNNSTRTIASGDYSKRINISRNDEIGELADNMNVMADSIEKNVKLLEETAENRKIFIDNLSHEMKTPLTSILGFSDLLRIKRNVSKEELTEYSSIIFNEAGRLKNLSGKLMEIITIGETITDFKECLASDLFSEIEITLKPLLDKNNIHLICNCDSCKINVDVELFKSMIFNLIENAIKASSPDSEIELIGTKKEDTLYIIIKDHGIGIPENALSKILEPFYMVDKARSRKAGGAGLGLALCKKIAEIHNASFVIESKLGEGTTVTLSINCIL